MKAALLSAYAAFNRAFSPETIQDSHGASAEELKLIRDFAPYTMTGDRRQIVFLRAVEYVDNSNIPGAIVECGVWRGGAMMLARKVCTKPREFHLFDTFAGMAEPTAIDVNRNGLVAMDKVSRLNKGSHVDWCYASLEEVRGNFEKFGLLSDQIHFHKGKVEDTLLTAHLPDQIAILRLDTDWYESTKLELEVLYPRLVAGGVLIIDDYGHWKGAKKAVDEYFGSNLPFLFPVDASCRTVIKR